MNRTATVGKVGRASAGTGRVFIRLEQVGVKFRLLTEKDLTLKGRILSRLAGEPKSDREFWALRGIDFEAGHGEVVGIIGPNGSGKSTLLRVIAGILYPSEGRVESRGQIQPLLDVGGTLNGNLTGRQNAYLYAALNRIPRRMMDELIPKIMDFAELGPFFDVPTRMYSSGMLARLSFALATALHPEVLLVDEVLAVGDERFQRKSYFRMLKLIERGSLVLIVSHNLAFIEQVCTRAILLSAGRIAADGRPGDVIARYRRQIG